MCVVVVCKVIFVSNPTFVELTNVVLELFWGCGWGCDNLEMSQKMGDRGHIQPLESL